MGQCSNFDGTIFAAIRHADVHRIKRSLMTLLGRDHQKPKWIGSNVVAADGVAQCSDLISIDGHTVIPGASILILSAPRAKVDFKR